MNTQILPAVGQTMTGDRRKVVLVVDDDGDARDLLASVLEGAAYDVLQARDGADALRVLADGGAACDIILLDLTMPVMNGWDFRHNQRANARLAGIPVLLMSAIAQLPTACGELDAAGYMTKPLEMTDLLAKVKKHCA
jgi:DNA-binding response OmpR family regulator